MCNPSDVLSGVCAAILRGDMDGAKVQAERDYPFVPTIPDKRSFGKRAAFRIFLRDGFLDRYTGERLIFPGALRLLSVLLPEQFPAHPNWKMAETHFMFWELYPTLDHVLPIARGGQDDESNLVTTSMLRNQAKGHWTLEELGWRLRETDSGRAWDGLTGWFVEMYPRVPEAAGVEYLREWYRVAREV